MRGRVSHATFELKALIQKRVGSTLDRVGGVLEEIDEEVAIVEREQGRGKPLLELEFDEEANREKEKPKGDGEYEAEGELAGLSDARAAEAAARRAAEAITAARDDRAWWVCVRKRDLWGMEKAFRSLENGFLQEGFS